jgi:NAD(P)-dependent dehydrogenase (short-subunit alcohol dehydrogenase family)
MSRIVLTGGNKGIGFEIFKSLRARGDEVITILRNESSALQLKKHFSDATIYLADLNASHEIESVARDISDRFDCIDTLICNAAISQKGGKGLEKPDHDKWRDMFNVNVLAPYILTLGLHERMKKSDAASIAYISSISGSMQAGKNKGTLPYTLSKAALNRLSIYMADWLGADHIHVLALEPGWVKTSLTNFAGTLEPQDAAQGIVDVVTRCRDFPTGSFVRYDGTRLDM